MNPPVEAPTSSAAAPGDVEPEARRARWRASSRRARRTRSRRVDVDDDVVGDQLARLRGPPALGAEQHLARHHRGRGARARGEQPALGQQGVEADPRHRRRRSVRPAATRVSAAHSELRRQRAPSVCDDDRAAPRPPPDPLRPGDAGRPGRSSVAPFALGLSTAAHRRRRRRRRPRRRASRCRRSTPAARPRSRAHHAADLGLALGLAGAAIVVRSPSTPAAALLFGAAAAGPAGAQPHHALHRALGPKTSLRDHITKTHSSISPPRNGPPPRRAVSL